MSVYRCTLTLRIQIQDRDDSYERNVETIAGSDICHLDRQH